jgi:hypothetical protein
VSSGPFTYSLSAAAAYAIRSLMERPDLRTPEEIADAPLSGETIDAETARGGLGELADHDLAVEGSDGRWELTDAGRRAQQPA